MPTSQARAPRGRSGERPVGASQRSGTNELRPPPPTGYITHASGAAQGSSSATAHVNNVTVGVELLQGAEDAAVDIQELLHGDVLRSACSTRSLLPLYHAERDPRMESGDLAADMDALDLRHLSLRRSSRLAEKIAKEHASLPSAHNSLPAPLPRGEKRMLPAARPPDAPPAKKCKPMEGSKNAKWLDDQWRLRFPDGGWSFSSQVTLRGTHSPMHASLPSLPPPPTSSPDDVSNASGEASGPKRKRKRHKPGAGHRRTRGAGWASLEKKQMRAFSRGDTLTASSFSLLDDATVARTGWQGALPPKLAREALLALWREAPNGAALQPYLMHFFPVPYVKCDDLKNERSTFFVDRDGMIFMFRSYRIHWLMRQAAAVEAACQVLLGNDLDSNELRAHFRGRTRGSHLAIIIGHQRQSAQKPYLTAWHREHQDRVDAFLKLDVVKQIIDIVSKLVETVFPGVAERFRRDAQWHEEHYGIKPLFGLFWNFCLNAWFQGQRRISCDPHADSKNQIGVCALFIYLLQSIGKHYNDDIRTWLVVWEAGVAVQLPPWTVALYPSALFYHFNIDVQDIKFVTVEGVARPTPWNSKPLVTDDDCGRGSMVFFNQATMRQASVLGYDTVKLAREHGLDVTIDFGEDANEAFQRTVVLKPVEHFL